MGPQRETVLDLNDGRCCLYGCDIMDMKMSPSHRRAAFAAVRDGSPVLVLKNVDDGALAAKHGVALGMLAAVSLRPRHPWQLRMA